LAHQHLRAGKVVFLSFDIETGGEFCGILQLSAEIARIELLPSTTAKGVVSSTGDTASAINRATENSYHFENIPSLLDRNIAEPEIAQNFLSCAATFPPTPTIPLNNAEVTATESSIHDGGTNVMPTNRCFRVQPCYCQLHRDATTTI
jgi:hypothetical protein